MPKERKKDMPINVFSPQDNPYKTAAANLFNTQSPDFNTVIQGMPKLVPPKNPVLEQLPGRFVENQAKLQGMINDYESLAGQVSDTPLPSATPTETTGTLTAPASAQATATPAKLTDADIRKFLDSAGYVDPYNAEQQGMKTFGNPAYEPQLREPTRQDLWENLVGGAFGTEGSYLRSPMDAQGALYNNLIYNRYGLPDDSWSQVLQWINENAPTGKQATDVGLASGKEYDRLFQSLAHKRQEDSASSFEQTWMPYIGTGIKTLAEALLTIVAPPVGAAMVAGDVAARSGASGDSLGSSLGKGLASGALTYVGGQLAQPAAAADTAGGWTGAMADTLNSAQQSMSQAALNAPELASASSGGWMGDITSGLQGAQQALSKAAMESPESYKAAIAQAAQSGLSAKDILTSPITRKLAGEIMGNIAGSGQSESNADLYNYYMQLLAAQNQDTLESTPSDTGNGGYTYTQMLQEPAAEASASTPFLSAKDRAKLISQIRAARRAQ